MLTMSGLPRFMICPASAVLTQIGRASEDGRRGTEIHNLIEDAILRPEVSSVALRDPGEPIDLAAIRGWFPSLDGLHIEPKVAWDAAAQRGRFILRPGARDYGEVGPDEIPGSADLALWHDGTLYLADIKTGFHQDQFAGAAAGNWQLRGLALAIAGAAAEEPLPVYSVRAALLKVREDGRVDIDEAMWSPADLADFGDELARAWAARGPRAVTSQWCGFCPCLMSCPQTVQAVRVLDPVAVIEDPAGLVAAATPAQVAAALTAWRHLERIGKQVEARAKLLAREGLLPGYRIAERERRELAGGIAHRVLTEYDGAQLARDACTVTTSQAQIKSALRLLRARLDALPGEPQPRGWLAQAEREVMARIEAAGGIERKPYEVLIEDEPALPAGGET